MVCLDSDILIDFLNNKKEAVQRINKLKNDDVQLAITTINSFELLNVSDKEKLQKVKDFILNFTIYDFNFESSENAAKIFQELKARGEIIEITDIMIASIVMANNETLLTNNVKHFERITNLELE